MAEIRFRAMGQVRMIEELLNIFVPLLVFYIVFEKLLWTCSSRTREVWKVFTVDRFKYLLTIATLLYAIFGMILVTWSMAVSDKKWFLITDKIANFQVASSHFWDVLLLPLPLKHPLPRFFQQYLFPILSFLLSPITFIIALITLCRISRVGEGEKPVVQEELNNVAVSSKLWVIALLSVQDHLITLSEPLER